MEVNFLSDLPAICQRFLLHLDANPHDVYSDLPEEFQGDNFHGLIQACRLHGAVDVGLAHKGLREALRGRGELGSKEEHVYLTEKGCALVAQHKLAADDATPPETGGKRDNRKLGVSLRDAAIAITGGDRELVARKTRSWGRDRTPKPKKIGYDPKHKQRKLYELTAICTWIEKIEPKSICRERKLRQQLTAKLRPPRGK